MTDAFTCPRLIEVSLPIREISAESVRDKSLRHGHISTLHLWWARRPLAASRAIVFASLVPDPDDPRCPAAFSQTVERCLKTGVPSALKAYTRGRLNISDPDPYRPYDGIPDTLRNRLLAFLAKWSKEALDYEFGKSAKQPKPAELLDDRCLVKWETSDPENRQGREILRIARELIRSGCDGKTPTVLDPFAGGGAIPLEAGRLGCRAIANDYNPVAYLILRATCEFPQKYGKPGKRKAIREDMGTPSEEIIAIPNVLIHDVKTWAHRILDRAKERIGHLYPAGDDGNTVVGWLWARTAPCSNPACRAEIPLLRSLLVCNKENKKVALTMAVEGKEILFGIARDREINRSEGTMINRGDCRCPVCGQITPVEDLRRAGQEGRMGERMVIAITDTPHGKDYRQIEKTDINAFQEAKRLSENVERPSEEIPKNQWEIKTWLYGMTTWGSLFNPRQLLAMQTFISCLHEALEAMEKQGWDDGYRQAVATYLGLWVSRIASRSSNVGIWHTSGEKIEHPFGRQAIPMVWDYPEANPFSESTGGAEGQLNWMLRVILHESSSELANAMSSSVLCGDGAGLSIPGHTADVVATDPPYFDAIAYADLSDYFYIWLKRGLGDVFPEGFMTPLTPKGEEATALRHRHGGDVQEARKHFSTKLAACLAEAKRICAPDGVLSIMFAHQSTEAWTALIHALFEAGLNVTATYPIDTELTTALKSWMSALESSITVVCRPRIAVSAASFQDVRQEIEDVVRESVHRFFDVYRFKGADLIVACYGPAIGVFGKYERVERADGTPVTVPELLETARAAALKAIAGEFQGDGLSRLYYVWLSQYGLSPQSFDDLIKVVQMGIESEDAIELARHRGLFVVDGSACRLALLRDRAEQRRLGDDPGAPLIDQLHRAMVFWKEERRSDLVQYLNDHDLLEHPPFWKLVQALFEVLPHGEEDWKIVSAFLGERDTLRIEARRIQTLIQARLESI